MSTVPLAGCLGDDDDDDDDDGDTGDDTDGGDSDSDDSDGGDDGDSADDGDDGEEFEGEIIIGNAAPFSGPVGTYGPYIEAGLEFAATEINADGGVLDHELVIESEDNESAPEPTATTFQRLAEDAVAITGPVISDATIRGRQEAEDAEIPFLPIQGASPSVLTRDTRYTFRVGAAGAPYYAAATAELIEQEEITQYGAIIAEYAYGLSYEQGVEEYIQPIDGLESTVERAPLTAEDFATQLRSMPDDLEFMDLGGHPVGMPTIIPQMWDQGLEPQYTPGPGDPFQNFWDSLGEDIDRGITQIHSMDPNADDYAEVGQRYYEETGEYFEPFVAIGYTVANLVAEALEEAGEADPVALRDAISGISYDSILAYPIEYTEWGELQDVRLSALAFTTEAPPYYPDGNFHVETLNVSDPFEPLDPDDWD